MLFLEKEVLERSSGGQGERFEVGGGGRLEGKSEAIWGSKRLRIEGARAG